MIIQGCSCLVPDDSLHCSSKHLLNPPRMRITRTHLSISQIAIATLQSSLWNRESSKIIHPPKIYHVYSGYPQNNQPFSKTHHFAGLLGYRIIKSCSPNSLKRKANKNNSRFVLFKALPAIQMPLPSAQLVHKHRWQHHNLELPSQIKPILGGWFRFRYSIYIYIARNIDYILLYDKTCFLL